MTEATIILKEELENMLTSAFDKGVQCAFDEMIDVFQNIKKAKGEGSFNINKIISLLKEGRDDEGGLKRDVTH